MINANIHDLYTPADFNDWSFNIIDFHCHGVGEFDFTEISVLNLDKIETILAQKNIHSILTLYLKKHEFPLFIELLERFHLGCEAGKYPHIKGFGLEGPLLASSGGTPLECVWLPSKLQWQELAKCGKNGLVYVILSPDAFLKGSPFEGEMKSPSISWIAETLLNGGVLPSPGHFTKHNPVASAQAVQTLFDVVKAWGHGFTITDHLYNDTPCSFKYAWRTDQDRLRRDKDVEFLNAQQWDLSSLEEKIGILPATILKNALQGLVKICLNFDGEHVDFAVINKTIEFVGASNLLMMTDSIESKRLAGRSLHMLPNSTLLYQDKGIVAAGTQNTFRQIQNMKSIGLELQQIEMMTNKVPTTILQQQVNYLKQKRNIER